MGESFGAYKLGQDEELMKSITSANIACGWHAGDPAVMNRTVQMAAAHGVGIGAHPGYPDLLGFGRRYMDCTAEEIRNYVIYQVGALKGFCSANGAKMQHVKPHGALYNASVDNEAIATAIAEGIARVDPELLYVVLAGPKSAALAEIGAKRRHPRGLRGVCGSCVHPTGDLGFPARTGRCDKRQPCRWRLGR